MATRSTKPAVKAALIDLLSQRPALVDVQTDRAFPPDLQDEVIHCGEIRGSGQEQKIAAGRRRRDEEYVLDVWIFAKKPGQTIDDAESRAGELVGELEDVLASVNDANTPLLVAEVEGLQWALPGSDDWSTAATTEGYACVVRFEVACRARLI